MILLWNLNSSWPLTPMQRSTTVQIPQQYHLTDEGVDRRNVWEELKYLCVTHSVVCKSLLQIWYWLFLPVKQWREQKSSQNHFWHNNSVCPDGWAHSEVYCLPTSRVNRKNLSEDACVIKGTLISAILKTNMVTPIFFAFSDRKWIKKCLYQIWAKSYRFWKFIETAANLLKPRWETVHTQLL